MERVMGMTAMDGGNTGYAGAIASANHLINRVRLDLNTPTRICRNDH